MEDGREAIGLIERSFPGAVLARESFRDQHWARIVPGQLVEICEWLRDDPAADFDMLLDVTAVHWPDEPEPFEVVYHLFSTRRNDRLRLKVRTGDGGSVPTLCGVWKSAEWNERETFDMFGLRFDGHPDLRRILMPEDYTDHPLRKEFPLYRS